MAVDFSRMGLEGIETGQRTLNSIAARESQALQDSIKLGEYQREEDALALDRLAVDNAKQIMAGEGRSIDASTSTEDDMARFLALTGNQLAAAGAPKRGQEMMEASLDLMKKRADINKTADDHAKVRLENMVKGSDYMYELLSDSLNESEYQFNLANIPDDIVQIVGAENVETLKNTPWSPELVDYFKTKALSVKEQAQLEMTAQGHRRAEQASKDAAEFRRIALGMQERRVAAAERREAAVTKAGGTNVSKAPTGDERRAARAAIVGIMEGMPLAREAKDDPADMMAAIEDIVGEAKQLVADSPGLTFNEAVNRAVLAAKGRGDFEPIMMQNKFLGVNVGKPYKEGERYAPKGRTREAPAPLPADKSKWVEGRFYIKNGKVGQYGTDFN